MLRPKKTKFRKHRKGSLNFTPKNTLLLERFKEGTVRLESLQFARITAKQLESCRQSINKRIKRKGKLQVRVFQIGRLQANLQKYEWVKEKVP